jgi:hypothetical protein
VSDKSSVANEPAPLLVVQKPCVLPQPTSETRNSNFDGLKLARQRELLVPMYLDALAGTSAIILGILDLLASILWTRLKLDGVTSLESLITNRQSHLNLRVLLCIRGM